MKNEVINSFAEGLVSDLNELNTPNKVMTDALNATLITFNGNEFSLQNDMGNAKVGTAYLPQGYVPVGMKEHGGIIYVASHNPETGRGQIGCFPSPQELWSGEDGDVAEITIDLSKLLEIITINDSTSYLQVKNEFYRKDIFLDNTTNKPRIFHPGDKFIITCKSLSEIQSLLDEGVLTLKLASVGTDGVLNYIDNSKLNIYKNGTFIYTGSEDVKDLLKNNEYIQVFPGTSSGKLMLIVEYNVYDTFDLSWSFSKNEKGIIQASFSGNTEQGNSELYNINDGGVYNTIKDSYLTLSANSENNINYNIAPYSKYGIVERLIRNGSINVANLTEKGNIDQWSYFVGNDYIDITWSFQYLDINGKEAQSMRFVFIPLEAINDTCNVKSDITDSSGKYWHNIELEKASYNGNFDEHILFIDGKFEKNSHYVCRIDKIIDGGNWEAVGYEYVCTYKIFNNLSADTIKKYREGEGIPNITIEPTIKGDIIATSVSSEYYTIESNNYKGLSNISSVAILNPEKDKEYNFRHGVRKTYELSDNFNIDTIITDSNINLDNLFISNYISTSINKNTSKINSNIKNQFSGVTSSENYKKDTLTDNTLTLYREIYSSSNNIRTKVLNNIEMLSPIYEEDSEFIYSPNKNDGSILAVGVNDARTRTNVKVNRNTVFLSNDSGDLYGADSTFGTLSQALDKMKVENNTSNGTIGAITDINGKDVYKNDVSQGSMTAIYANTFKVSTNLVIDGKNIPFKLVKNNYWGRSWEEDDNYTSESNFEGIFQRDLIIPTCESENGNHYLFNLVVPKSDENNPSTARFDRVIRGIFSQLLVVKNKSNWPVSYIKPDENIYNYNSFDSYTDVNITYKSTVTKTGLYNELNNLKTQWEEEIDDLKCYIPVITTKEKTITKSIKIGENDFVNELSHLINLYSAQTLEISEVPKAHPLLDEVGIEVPEDWRQCIYWGVVNKIESDGTCVLDKDSLGRYNVRTSFKYTEDGIEKIIETDKFGKASTYLTDFGSTNNSIDYPTYYILTGNINEYLTTNNTLTQLNSSHITKLLFKASKTNDARSNSGMIYWGYADRGDSEGPLIIINMHFGPYSIWTWDTKQQLIFPKKN